jgi:hypothetical protein
MNQGRASQERPTELLQGFGGGCFANHDAKRWNAELVLGEEHHSATALNRILVKIKKKGGIQAGEEIFLRYGQTSSTENILDVHS